MKPYHPALFAMLSSCALLVFAFSAHAAQAQSDTPAPAAAKIPITTTTSPEIRELQKVEDNWAGALNQHDQYALELVLSPLFVDVSATGDISTRDQQIASLVSPADSKDASTHTQRVITVRMLGDVAVANGTYSWTHKVSGSVIEEKGVFIHVFQRLHGNWLCINAQRTALSQAAPTTTTKVKATKQKSGAELPFHIPLFTKSDKSDTPNQ